MNNGVMFGAEKVSDAGAGADTTLVYTDSIRLYFSDEMLRDMGLLPSEPLPPTPRLARWRRAVLSGYWTLRWRLAEVIAGQSLDQDDDW